MHSRHRSSAGGNKPRTFLKTACDSSCSSGIRVTCGRVAVMSNVQANLADVLARIAAVAAGRQVRLVAVSKTKSEGDVRAAYDAGQRHFGENYAQELAEKAPQLPADVRWHFIGHLQTNKAKLVANVPGLYMVETIDSAKLASALNRALPETAPPLRVLIQVNTSGEDGASRRSRIVSLLTRAIFSWQPRAACTRADASTWHVISWARARAFVFAAS